MAARGRPDRPHDGQAGRPFFGRMRTLEREIRNFDTDVLERSRRRLVLAEFWAPWSPECRRLRPALEHVSAAFAGRLELVSVNVEMQSEVVADEGVHGLPLVRAYLRGRAVGEMTGVVSEPGIRDWVEELLEDHRSRRSAAR